MSVAAAASGVGGSGRAIISSRFLPTKPVAYRWRVMVGVMSRGAGWARVRVRVRTRVRVGLRVRLRVRVRVRVKVGVRVRVRANGYGEARVTSVADSSDSAPVSSPAMEVRAEATCETPSAVAVIVLRAWSRLGLG